MSLHVERYIAIKRSLGYKFEDQEQVLMNFALFTEGQGDRFARADRMIEWASKAPSVHRSRDWLRTVRAFAVSLHAEDDRHEIPPRTAFGSGKRPRPVPHLITLSQIERLMEAARSLPPVASITPYTFRCMIGLIATTGLRVSEAVALRLADLTRDGLLIRETKFRKSRLVPIHKSTRNALKEYLSLRTRIGGPDRHLFVLSTGEAPGHGDGRTCVPQGCSPDRSSRRAGPARSQTSRPAAQFCRSLPGAVRERQECGQAAHVGAEHLPWPHQHLRYVLVSRGNARTAPHGRPGGRMRTDGEGLAMTALAPHIGSFLQEYLPRDRRASRHTTDTYAYSFQLLVQYAAERLQTRPCLIEIEDLTVQLILDFLDYLEQERGNTVRTRNVRLAAFKSFFRRGIHLAPHGTRCSGG